MENIKKIVKKMFRKFPILSNIPFTNRKRIYGWGNLIRNRGKMYYRNRVRIKGSNNIIDLMAGGQLCGCNIIINGNNNQIEIGEDASAIHLTIVVEDDNNKIVIGDDTKMGGTTLLAALEGTEIRIGKDCLFSSDVELRTGDSHAVENMEHDRINPSKGIIVGNHVWIGHKTIILKGVEISDNTIVGTGSVVTKSPGKENVAIAGNPAHVIKERVSWNNMR